MTVTTNAAAVEAVASAIHADRCRAEWCRVPFGYEDERAARSALEVVLPHLLPGLFVTRSGIDGVIWAETDRPAYPADLLHRTGSNALLFDALAALLPDRTEEDPS